MFVYCTVNRRGANRWRDYQLPKEILDWYCKAKSLQEQLQWISDEEVMFKRKRFTLKDLSEHFANMQVCYVQNVYSNNG